MDVISTKPPQFDNTEIQKFLQNVYGIDGTIFLLDSERDQNFKVICEIGNEFILKISNPHENIEIVKLQSAAIKHIHEYDSTLNVPILIKSKEGNIINTLRGNFVRVQTFLKGRFIKELSSPPLKLLHEFGQFFAKLDLAIKEFEYPTIKKNWVWDIRNIRFLKKYLKYFNSNNDQKIINHFISNYESNIYPIEKHLRQQYIHNDGNDHNVLLDETGSISGIIDFGDMAHSFLVCELAVAITYLILEDESPKGKIKSAVEGYQSLLPLRIEEIESLIHLICIRACLTVVTANYRKKLFPENDYIIVTEEKAWTFLRNFSDIDLRSYKIY